MLRMSTPTDLSVKEVMDQALAFFGPDGLQLETKEFGTDKARFEGAGGGVEIAVNKVHDETTVELFSREWDTQAREFLGNVARKPESKK